MVDDRPTGLRLATQLDRLDRLRADLPPAWRGPVIGPDIPGWYDAPGAHIDNLHLADLPEPLHTELAWIAHWQEIIDGTPTSVQTINQFALAYRRATSEGRDLPTSILDIDWQAAEALLGRYYATRWKRLMPVACRGRLRGLFRIPRLALIVACHDGHWWELDTWLPRCDPRIPIGAREPHAGRITPGNLTQPWLRAAVKWHLGTQLEAGVLRWGTICQARQLTRFDRWITSTFNDPREVLTDPASASAHAAAFRRWAADPMNRINRTNERHRSGKPVHPRQVNDDLRAIAELFDFVATNTGEARTVLAASPWPTITVPHADSWRRQVSRIRHTTQLNDDHYVDDHALAQIIAALPLLGLPRGEHMPITRGDGTTITAEGYGDPQVMRMILLQILTGRRSSEIRLCEFDCLTPASTAATDSVDGAGLSRLRYAQSKIDIAPDTILVDDEVAAVIDDQQQWVRDRFPGVALPYLFTQRFSNLAGAKPYASTTYNRILNKFTDIVQISDSKGRHVRLGHTHRFRHTKLTRLAELGLPIKVLQRYAGHATPTMSMHYIAQREEHAEQAFLATAKFKADGTQISFSREDHDGMRLFDRADRILPHGWCLLPPLQTCDKGNACLTCSVFVTDHSHQATLQQQLTDTSALIDRTVAAFEQRHGKPMPADNVWLAQRRAEQAALTQLLAKIPHQPGHAIEGGGCAAAPATRRGPARIELDLTRHRRTQP